MNGLFIGKLVDNPEIYIVTVVVVIFSICMHEASHALTARLCGDRTAWDNGYMTLNPLKLMGIPSLIMLAVCGIAWGMVPVDPDRLRPQWRRGLVAVSGPAANLALALFFSAGLLAYSLLGRLLMGAGFLRGEFSHYVLLLLVVGILMNVVLALFNLLPVPPLDGWDVFATIFPPLQRVNVELRNAAVVVIFFLMISGGIGFLYRPARWILNGVCALAGLDMGGGG
jgi:Zn-dependent protease